jgi:hypothetical protein
LGIKQSNQEVFSKEQARMDIEEPLLIKAAENSEFIIIDIPSCKGWGYSSEPLQGAGK